MSGNIAAIPLSVIATWPKPNYVDPYQRTWLVPFAAVLQAITTLFVTLRFYLRIRKQAGPLGLDDALLVPAFLGSTLFTALICIAIERYGVGRHTWNTPVGYFEEVVLIAWTSETAFLISTGCTKISVLLFFRRLSQGISNVWKYTIFAGITFVICYVLTFILALVFTCRPTEAYWKLYSGSYTEKYTCADLTILNLLNGVFSVFSDFFSVLLPLAMVRTLNVDAPRNQKIALNVVFCLGLVVVACGSVRAYYTYELGRTYDPSWLGFDLYVWSDLEVQLSIICASAPALRVFFRRYLSHPMSRIMNSQSTANRNLRDSKMVDLEIAAHLHEQEYSNDDKELMKNQFDTGLHLSSEDETDCGTSATTALSENTIKSPEDFVAYELSNLEKNRPPQVSMFHAQ